MKHCLFHHNQLQRLLRLFFVFCLVLFLSSCKAGISPGVVREVIYHQGFDGLDLQLVQNLPPDKVFQGSEFLISLELRNNGAYPIKDGQLQLSDIPNQKYVVISPVSQLFDLEGKSPSYPEGEFTIIDFTGRSVDFPRDAEKYDSSFSFSAYYDYETDATVEICVNPNIYNFAKDVEKDACETKSVSLSGGQGAPVAIMKVDPKPSIASKESAINMDLDVHIENKGKGDVFKDVVEVEEATLGGQPLDCFPKVIDLKKQKNPVLSCSVALDRPRGSYISPLRIRFSYIYTQKVSKKVEVRKRA